MFIFMFIFNPYGSLPKHGSPSLTSTGTATLRGSGGSPYHDSIPAVRALFSSACFLHLYRLFWNQILTWLDVSFSMLARWSLSGAERYFCCLNRLSNSYTCAWENRTRGFRRIRFCLLGTSVVAKLGFETAWCISLALGEVCCVCWSSWLISWLSDLLFNCESIDTAMYRKNSFVKTKRKLSTTPSL